jgi:hypothetical protein
MSERVSLTPENTHILDSAFIRSRTEIRNFLLALREQCEPGMAVAVRDLESQVREWRAHNFFYALHVFRSRTKDVDLELHQTWIRELFCRVFDFFYFWDR